MTAIGRTPGFVSSCVYQPSIGPPAVGSSNESTRFVLGQPETEWLMRELIGRAIHKAGGETIEVSMIC
jgi:hypothetical protein